MTADTKLPPPGVALARGPPGTCEYEASCAHAIETSLGIQGLGVHREHDRIVREIARTVDGTDPFAAVVRASQMACAQDASYSHVPGGPLARATPGGGSFVSAVIRSPAVNRTGFRSAHWTAGTHPARYGACRKVQAKACFPSWGESP
ncbi:hypothetical protein MKK58_00005, partial [Methylobacterium sp. J-078]|uniref:hypothetical protein n=1 Tax=Methylobacterium sp. J-078 TaxID=2836657 RepID=UPI001FBA7472